MLDVFVAILKGVEVIVALLLITVILLQQSKGGGGLGAVGGEVTESVFGASTGNVMTRITVALASVFLGITLLLAIISGHRQQGTSVAETLSAEPAAETQTSEPAAEPEGMEGAETAPAATEAGKEAGERSEDTAGQGQ